MPALSFEEHDQQCGNGRSPGSRLRRPHPPSQSFDQWLRSRTRRLQWRDRVGFSPTSLVGLERRRRHRPIIIAESISWRNLPWSCGLTTARPDDGRPASGVGLCVYSAHPGRALV